MAEHDRQLNQSSNSAPFVLAGFDPRQIRPRLPSGRATGAAFFAEIVHRTISDRSSPRGRRVAAPAQAGAAGLLASGLGRAPCLRACALRQSDRENAPLERFQAALWGRRKRGAKRGVFWAFARDRSSAFSCGPAVDHAGVLPMTPSRASDVPLVPDRPVADVIWRRSGRSADGIVSGSILDMLHHCLRRHVARPFFLAGFVRRQIRPRLPALWQARSAPAQAGAAGVSAAGLGRAPCLRACALRQSDRENAPPERFQAVLWGHKARRARGATSGAFAGVRSSASSFDNESGRAPACTP
jgi:hypothetical protein